MHETVESGGSRAHCLDYIPDWNTGTSVRCESSKIAEDGSSLARKDQLGWRWSTAPIPVTTHTGGLHFEQ